ncbi:MAG: hypothetical protein KDC95_09395 [Planctomycetes bacterium]|nr:hypothetical protein [Planctomycetota bacterium]
MDRDVFSRLLEGAVGHAGTRDVALAAGRVCGKVFAEELESSVQSHYDVALREIPLVEFRELIARACEGHGYARVSLDTTHVADGVLEIGFEREARGDLELAFQSGLVITVLERLTGDAALGGVLVEDRDGSTSCIITSKERLAGHTSESRPDRAEILASLRMVEGVAS